jgi:hypothetical protein
MGFVPHDQEDFFKAMREMIETHKKEQQAKQQQQKMVRNLLLYFKLELIRGSFWDLICMSIHFV